MRATMPTPNSQFVVAPNLDCTVGGNIKCPCWTDNMKARSRAGTIPPTVAVTLEQVRAGPRGCGARLPAAKPAAAQRLPLPPRQQGPAAGCRTADAPRPNPDAPASCCPQAGWLRAAVKAAAKAGGRAPTAFVQTKYSPYRRMSGTSMAT